MLSTDLLHILLAIALGFVIAVAAIPPILKVAREKRLFDPPDERKLHSHAIPPLGGIAIFLGVVLSIVFSSHGLHLYPLRYIIAAIILMFFIGLKDDLISISPRKKFAIQVLTIFSLIFFSNIQLTNLHGLFGIYSIHPVVGMFLTFFVMLAIINAFNLIDGIDGLASGLAITAGIAFGSWFYLAGHIQYSIISFALAGSLCGFFLFNVFGHKNKLFMGDTGSLVVGLIIAILTVKFNELNIIKTIPYAIGAAPSVSLAIIIVPLIDTLRVITIRIGSGRSPFSPDRNHIHHRLLEFFPSHLAVTIVLVSANITIMALALYLNKMFTGNTSQFMFILVISVFLSFIPSHLLKFRNLKKPGGYNLTIANIQDKVRQLPTNMESSAKEKIQSRI
jgi:UDP-GlcNAc:undecaprenyl-phosphate/decaprenyl-phosphate GlcNAc-1-phosphate transferase